MATIRQNLNVLNLKSSVVDLDQSIFLLFSFVCIFFISCLYLLSIHLGRWGAIAADTVVTMTRCGVVTMGTNDGDPVSTGGNV